MIPAHQDNQMRETLERAHREAQLRRFEFTDFDHEIGSTDRAVDDKDSWAIEERQ